VVDPMGLAQTIRSKVDARVLPSGTPDAVCARHGNGERCDGCDDVIAPGELQYAVDLRQLGPLLFHAGCFGLWEAEMLRRGWLRQPLPRS